jgi:hypothetical protein
MPENLWGNGCIDPDFLDHGTNQRLSGQLQALAALSLEKNSLVPIGKEVV